MGFIFQQGNIQNFIANLNLNVFSITVPCIYGAVSWNISSGGFSRTATSSLNETCFNITSTTNTTSNSTNTNNSTCTTLCEIKSNNTICNGTCNLFYTCNSGVCICNDSSCNSTTNSTTTNSTCSNICEITSNGTICNGTCDLYYLCTSGVCICNDSACNINTTDSTVTIMLVGIIVTLGGLVTVYILAFYYSGGTVQTSYKLISKNINYNEYSDTESDEGIFRRVNNYKGKNKQNYKRIQKN